MQSGRPPCPRRARCHRAAARPCRAPCPGPDTAAREKTVTGGGIAAESHVRQPPVPAVRSLRHNSHSARAPASSGALLTSDAPCGPRPGWKDTLTSYR
jgi:hypothetical protein